MTQRILLHAPLAGWVSALREVPDPVFAERMMGEGLAIDPVQGVLVAPCEGEILLVPPSMHSVTIRARNGAEILIHVGIDTVGLKGAGFAAHVAAGQVVRTGDPLISFDLDVVVAGAASLVTPVVVTNGDGYSLRALVTDRPVELGDPIAEIVGEIGETRASPSGETRSEAELVVPLPNGIHARPAARIAERARQFAADLTLHAHGREANGRSPTALMILGARRGDALRIVGSGEDAEQAVAALVRLVTEEIEERPEQETTACPPAAPPPSSDGAITGVCAVPGLALGPAFRFRPADVAVAEDGDGAEVERERLERARAAVMHALGAAARGGGAAASIASAHRVLIEDVELLAAAEASLTAGRSAGFAWRRALRDRADALRATGNQLLIERVDDLLDLEQQVLAAMAGGTSAGPSYPAGAVLLADEMLPSQLVHLASCRPAAICIARGGPTSHAAVMAAAAGVPMLVAMGAGIDGIADGTCLLVDTAAGMLEVDPASDVLRAARARIAAADARHSEELAAATEICRTRDGARIEVFANLGSVAQAEEAVVAGAEGCGLLRTEFLFLDRQEPPSEAEQRMAYQAIADTLGDRPLIVRTLDVGGDKPIAYLPIPPEENPALGLRGVRASLWRTDLLEVQLRAILKVRPIGRCRIMVPMIVAPAELQKVRALVDRLAAELGLDRRVELGIMVETPAAAMLADQLAAEADFFSIGSNDLTQYTLAMDRGNPLVAAQVDAFHPAVLRLIRQAALGAAVHGRPIGTCGGLASDPLGAVLLVGLGVTELSVAPSAIPAVKAALRRRTIEECRRMAEQALAADSPDAVRGVARALDSTDGGEA